MALRTRIASLRVTRRADNTCCFDSCYVNSRECSRLSEAVFPGLCSTERAEYCQRTSWQDFRYRELGFEHFAKMLHLNTNGVTKVKAVTRGVSDYLKYRN
jgi:hypothetical protein